MYIFYGSATICTMISSISMSKSGAKTRLNNIQHSLVLKVEIEINAKIERNQSNQDCVNL